MVHRLILFGGVWMIWDGRLYHNISFMIIGGLLDGTNGFKNRIRLVYVNRIFGFLFFFSNEFKHDGAAQFHQPSQTYLSTTSYGDIQWYVAVFFIDDDIRLLLLSVIMYVSIIMSSFFFLFSFF